MSKTIPAALQTHMASGYTTLAYLWKITRQDGTVFGFTNHDEDLVVSGVTYEASTGFDATAIDSRSELNVDSMEVAGSLDSNAISEADLIAGLWDYAEVYIYRCNWADLTQGVEVMRRGWLGEVVVTDTGFKVELRGLMQPLQQKVIEVSTPACRATLGDARCMVRLDPPMWAPTTAYTVRTGSDAGAGSVVKPSTYNGRHFYCSVAGTSGSGEPGWNTTLGGTTTDGSVEWTTIEALTLEGTVNQVIVDQRQFEDVTLTQAAAYFQGGVVTWVTGANAGLSKEIKAHTLGSPAAAIINLTEPMPYVITPGDTYTITPGCLKRHLLDCRDKFDNIYNFRGEPDRPTPDNVIRGPL